MIFYIFSIIDLKLLFHLSFAYLSSIYFKLRVTYGLNITSCQKKNIYRQMHLNILWVSSSS